MELVCMDYLTLEPSKGGIGNILVITDHFTRYAIAIPTKNQTAKTTADAFFNNFVVHYGLPTKIHTDQGANFESDLIKEMCTITGIQKSRTTAYHPQCNGMTERFNRSLLGMLGTLEPEKKEDWKRYIGPLVHAYNSIRHESTGYSPYELMFGRSPRLPVDLTFGLNTATGTDETSHSEYACDLRKRLNKAYETVQRNADDSREKQKEQYDKKARAAGLNIGDKVLVKILAFSGKHKIADKFEDSYCVVVKQPNKDIPVFVVKAQDGRERTLHRNHLLPVEIGEQERPRTALEKPNEVERLRTPPVPKPRTRSTQKKLEVEEQDEKAVEKKREAICDVAEESDDSEEEYVKVTYLPAEADGDAHSSSSGSDSESAREEEEVDEEPEERDIDGDVEVVEEVATRGPDPQPEPPPAPPLRRSQRERRKPEWHNTYQMRQTESDRDSKRERVELIGKIMTTGLLQETTKDIVEKVVGALIT